VVGVQEKPVRLLSDLSGIRPCPPHPCGLSRCRTIGVGAFAQSFRRFFLRMQGLQGLGWAFEGRTLGQTDEWGLQPRPTLCAWDNLGSQEKAVWIRKWSQQETKKKLKCSWWGRDWFLDGGAGRCGDSSPPGYPPGMAARSFWLRTGTGQALRCWRGPVIGNRLVLQRVGKIWERSRFA